MNEAEDTSNVVGFCVYDRETGEHAGHVIFNDAEREMMPEYVETIEKIYKDTKWRTARISCSEV